MKWLRSVSFAKEVDTVRRDMLYERLCFLTKMIERVETTLARVASRHPGVQLLRTIPGVGPRTAEAVMAWVDDPSRFQRIKSVRRSTTIRAFYERVRRDDPERRKIALTATAHYLLRAMMAMLRTGEVWRLQEETAA